MTIVEIISVFAVAAIFWYWTSNLNFEQADLHLINSPFTYGRPSDSIRGSNWTRGPTVASKKSERQKTMTETNIAAISAERHGLTERDFGNLLADGDVTALSPVARVDVLVALALHVGLDPIERPFALLEEGGRVRIYARAACADGLCRTRGVGTELLDVSEVEICGTSQISATVRATVVDLDRLMMFTKAGVSGTEALAAATRSKTAVGSVSVLQPAKSEWKENANGKKHREVTEWRKPTPPEVSNLWMKSTTKAERRAVLKLCGLGGIRDESEVGDRQRVSQIEITPTPSDPLDPRRELALRSLGEVGIPVDGVLSYLKIDRVDQIDEEGLLRLRQLYQENARSSCAIE